MEATVLSDAAGVGVRVALPEVPLAAVVAFQGVAVGAAEAADQSR